MLYDQPPALYRRVESPLTTLNPPGLLPPQYHEPCVCSAEGGVRWKREVVVLNLHALRVHTALWACSGAVCENS